MRCVNCGMDIPDGSKFCNVCGEPIDDPIEVEKRESERAKWSFIWEQSKMIWLLFIPMGFLIGAVAAMMFVAQDKPIVKSTVIWAGVLGGLVYVIISYISLLFRSKRQKIIDLGQNGKKLLILSFIEIKQVFALYVVVILSRFIEKGIIGKRPFGVAFSRFEEHAIRQEWTQMRLCAIVSVAVINGILITIYGQLNKRDKQSKGTTSITP